MKKPLRSQLGMTLIEIMISMAIMAALTIFIARSIRQGARSKVKIEKDISRLSVVRDALKIMEADVNRAFNYRDINIKLYNEAMQEREKRLEEQAQNKKNKKDDDNSGSSTVSGSGGSSNDDDSGSDPAAPREPFVPREYIIVTHFVGDEDEMHFTSLNNIRSMAGIQQSDQMEVGYFLKSCRGRINKKKQSNCLWRRKSSILDDDVEQGGTETVLLEDVQSLKLRFLESATQEQPQPQWRPDWSSLGGKEPRLANHFPAAVEITLEVQNKDDKKSKRTAMTLTAAIRNPNNPDPNAQNGQNGQTGENGNETPQAQPTQ